MPTQTVVFDIDGTLANGLHRTHFICLENGRTEKDWDSYFKLLDKDTVNEAIAEICRTLYYAGVDIVYCTGRPARYIEATKEWLSKNNLPDGDIYHREDNDRRDDSILKLELLKEIEADGRRISIIFDDRNRVVLAARGAGYTVAQVADGDF